MKDQGLILHLPHDSTVIPADLRGQFALSDSELSEELVAMTDHFTADLFSPLCAANQTLRFPVSRLVVDPERFSDDSQEIMSSRGMGVIYTHTSTQASMRRPLNKEEREALLRRFYWPHHVALTALTQTTLDRCGHALILDAHSFPNFPRPYELNQDHHRPEICIGTDSIHTPPELRDAFVSAFQSIGFSVAVDTPFAGALVPAAYYRLENRVRSVMVEVNRGLYLDETSGKKRSDFEAVAKRVRAGCSNALNQFSSLCPQRQLDLAGEE